MSFNESRLEMKVEFGSSFGKIWLTGNIVYLINHEFLFRTRLDNIKWISFSNIILTILFFSFCLVFVPLTAQTGLLHEATIVITNHQVFEALFNPAVLKEGRRKECEGDWEINSWVVEDTLVLSNSPDSALYRAHPQSFSVINHQHAHSYKERDTISICS